MANCKHAEIPLDTERAGNSDALTTSGKTDVVKGRIKEAAGALTGDEKLRAEGKADQAVGNVTQAVQKAVDRVKDAAETVVDKAKKAKKTTV